MENRAAIKPEFLHLPFTMSALFISVKISAPAPQPPTEEVTKLCVYRPAALLLVLGFWSLDFSRKSLLQFLWPSSILLLFVSRLGNFQNIFTYYRISYFLKKLWLLPHFNNCPPFLCFLTWQKSLVRVFFINSAIETYKRVFSPKWSAL